MGFHLRCVRKRKKQNKINSSKIKKNISLTKKKKYFVGGEKKKEKKYDKEIRERVVK